ncbi:TSUP family transporter [Anoxybacterium hadale]|uniref:TSUP family transporter n=1 Tax=Anoxybacterium hadale TaxID=3408580 RepID=A0ACD1AD06_9FIRM|nr:TSUP family transporter [Clostridiales bacterium]
MVVKIVLALIVVVNGAFAISFIRDLIAHKAETFKEAGNPIAQAFSSFVIFFFSTFGISDFAISASLYPKLKWVEDKKLPGTMNAQCVIPVAVMALVYISAIDVDLVTLIVAIVAQIVGSYLSPRYVVKLPVDTIKRFVSAGLLIAAILILAGKFGVYPSGGEEIGLTGVKLVALGVLSFAFGALNNIGIGSYALTMATVYALGLSPAIAFPIMMGACTFSVPVGSMQFIKLDSYSRKITAFTSTFGVIGVLIAAYAVKSMNVSALQWVVVVVILYSAFTTFLSTTKNKANVKESK